MLAVEIYRKVSGEVAFPVHLDYEVIISRVQLDLDSPIAVAVYEIVDVSA